MEPIVRQDGTSLLRSVSHNSGYEIPVQDCEGEALQIARTPSQPTMFGQTSGSLTAASSSSTLLALGTEPSGSGSGIGSLRGVGNGNRGRREEYSGGGDDIDDDTNTNPFAALIAAFAPSRSWYTRINSGMGSGDDATDAGNGLPMPAMLRQRKWGVWSLKRLLRFDGIDENPYALVTFYFFMNLGLTIFNKIILKFFNFRFPWLLTAVHSIGSYLGCVYIIKVARTVKPEVPLTAPRDQLIVLLFSVLYNVNIAVSTITLDMVSLAFHQIVRSTNPAVTILLEWMFLSKWKNGVGFDIFSSLSLVIIGVGLATIGDYEFTAIGFIATFFGTVLSAVKGITTNTLLAGNGLKFHPIELVWHMSWLSFLQCIAISFCTGEMGRFFVFWGKLRAAAVERAAAAGTGVAFPASAVGMYSNIYWLYFALVMNGAMAFFLNYVSFTANKKVGALSIAVAGNVKQAMSLGLSVWIFGYVISLVNGMGILMTLIGGAWYSMIGVNKKKAKQATEQAK
ncbi:triose-phosphate transporter family-domain-containing protein [Chytriomyces sp. MP71]|nr:triose-phosphate transporter family-domain-containing protein [Chytriomyces sp. MP71]